MVTELEHNLAQRVSLGDIFRRQARHIPDREALVEKRAGERISFTYKTLNDQLNRFASALKDSGLKPGSKVAIIGPNSWELVVAMYGCAKGGFIAVPLNPRLGPDDIIFMLNHSEPEIIVVDDILCPLIDKIKDKCKTLKDFISIPATGNKCPEYFVDFKTFLGDQSEEEFEQVVWDRDPFAILYTSGTTARPKGVVLSHLSFYIMSLSNLIEMKIFREHNGAIVMPMFHCAQQTFATTHFHIGAKNVICRSFDPCAMLEVIQEEKIGSLFLLPMMWRTMLDHPRIKEYDVSSLQRCTYAMTPMDKRTLEQCMETFGPNFLLGTGQTEFFPSSECFKPEWQLEKMGNYWGDPALTVETAIMDEDDNLVPSGQMGEIVRRGPGHLIEYFKDPDATDEIRKFGWAHSGDLGYFDEDGLLVFVDRKKDMIKTGGENVPSIKVERAILSDPRVSEVAVVGLPHEKWVEAVTAFVVPKEKTLLSEEDVIAICKKELGGFEVPKRVVMVEELPKTTTGKLQKNIVKKQYWDLYNL
ncbi:MAG: AMP-binding protein [Desulfomonilaceae bacterium]